MPPRQSAPSSPSAGKRLPYPSLLPVALSVQPYSPFPARRATFSVVGSSTRGRFAVPFWAARAPAPSDSVVVGAYAALCAAAVSERLGATWGLAETGAAGPTGNRYGDAAGHTCVAIAGPKQSVMTLETEDSDRLANMYRFAGCAFEQLAARLAEV